MIGASQMMLGSGGALKCDSADFDGSNDYMTRGADLTGIVDGKQGTFSGWVRIDGGDGVERRLLINNPLVFNVNITTGNTFTVAGFNSSAIIILLLESATTYTAGATWLHVLASWDMATAGARHLYINDVDDLGSGPTFTNDTINYAGVANFAIGAATDGTAKFNGCLAELWFHTTYIDITNVVNRRKFITAAGKPAYLGPTGIIPLGVVPLVYQHLDVGAAVATFGTNLGSGGGWTITGTLATGSTSPSS